MIKDAELKLYDENWDEVTIPLSPTQLAAIIAVLGIEIPVGYTDKEPTIKCFSDASVEKMISYLPKK